MAIQTFTALQVLTAAQMNALQANDYNQTVSTKTASYTLVAADKGTKIVMNSASATTITVNTSLFSAGDTLTILNIAAGVCTITAGTATVSTTGSLALAQNGGGTLYFTSAGVSVFQADGVTAAGGLVCVKAETAFTAVASVTADSIFTSTYTNYLIKVIYTCSAAEALRLKLRVGGVSTATNYNRQEIQIAGSTVTGSSTTGTTSLFVGGATNGDFKSAVDLSLFGPQLAQATLINVFNAAMLGAATTPQLLLSGDNQSSSTQFDGVELFVNTGTITGTYAVYGYSKAV